SLKSLEDRLFPINKKGVLWLLIDPDVSSGERLRAMVEMAHLYGVDAILIGGSFLMGDGFDEAVRQAKVATTLPVIIFPGGAGQISRYADGILFTSLLSGRNPQFLVGEQVLAAPLVKKFGIPALPTAYLLVESGTTTSAEFISGTRPLPRNKPKLAAAHAMAAELLGMKAIYLEAGSGANLPVPEEMIFEVVHSVNLPIIVGGGIDDPDKAQRAAKAGARVVVVGTAAEQGDARILKEISLAING
ncbi:MAG: geranylgeranylglyceryl/heptaprenylglyceryl phosphate synthase, partial [bacterium]